MCSSIWHTTLAPASFYQYVFWLLFCLSAHSLPVFAIMIIVLNLLEVVELLWPAQHSRVFIEGVAVSREAYDLVVVLIE